MEQLILKPEALDRIKKDGELFIQVAKALNVSHFTLPDLIRRKDARLTQTSVIRLLKQSMGTNDENEILTEKTVKAVA